MSRKRCCCTGSQPGPSQCQPCPSGDGHEWIVQIIVDGIIGDSAGEGVVNGVDIWQSCLGGSCGRQIYRRRGGGNTTFMSTDCLDRVCDTITDIPAVTDAGDHTIRWSFCSVVYPTDPPGSPYLPDILNDQEGGVLIESVQPNLRWDFANCTYTGINTDDDCCTVIKVYFSYQDQFTYQRWNSDAGGCYSTTETFTLPIQTWTCYYVRRVAAGQYFAEGAYSLLRCEYPNAESTIGPTNTSGPCTVAGGVVCSAQHGVSTLPPTTWKPPANINLVRLS